MRGRFAPSPTGALHLGNLRTALVSWLQARSGRGEWLVRMEDLEAVAAPVLTHRILTNFQAQSEGVTSTDVITRLLAELRGESQRG